jgi:hypothetical protein
LQFWKIQDSEEEESGEPIKKYEEKFKVEVNCSENANKLQLNTLDLTSSVTLKNWIPRTLEISSSGSGHQSHTPHHSLALPHSPNASFASGASSSPRRKQLLQEQAARLRFSIPLELTFKWSDFLANSGEGSISITLVQSSIENLFLRGILHPNSALAFKLISNSKFSQFEQKSLNMAQLQGTISFNCFHKEDMLQITLNQQDSPQQNEEDRTPSPREDTDTPIQTQQSGKENRFQRGVNTVIVVKLMEKVLSHKKNLDCLYPLCDDVLHFKLNYSTTPIQREFQTEEFG